MQELGSSIQYDLLNLLNKSRKNNNNNMNNINNMKNEVCVFIISVLMVLMFSYRYTRQDIEIGQWPNNRDATLHPWPSRAT